MKNLLDKNKKKKIYSFSRLFDDNFYILSEFIAARKKIEFNAIAYIYSHLVIYGKNYASNSNLHVNHCDDSITGTYETFSMLKTTKMNYLLCRLTFILIFRFISV